MTDPKDQKKEILDAIEVQKEELSRAADLAQSVLVMQDKAHTSIATLKRRIKLSGGATQITAQDALELVDNVFQFTMITHQSAVTTDALFHQQQNLFQTKMAALERLLVDKKEVFTREEIEEVLKELRAEALEKAEMIREVKKDADFDAAVEDLKRK